MMMCIVSLGIYRQWMSFGIEYEFVQRNELTVIGKQEVEVFQCLSEPEALHLVAILWTVGRFDVSD